MARTFVYSDNLTARVELVQDALTGHYAAFCAGCTGFRRTDDAADLLAGSHERFNLEDAGQVAGAHADRCRRCADPYCRTPGSHDAGHRCRK